MAKEYKITKKKKQGKVRKKKSANVPGQYLGYSLQTTRFLTRLLEADKGVVVSLEVFDDIGTEDQLGQRVAEQGKSALASNPVADRSKDLWKTFSNWLDSIESGVLNIDNTEFEIYVSHPKQGNIVKSFSDAKTLEDAKKALATAKQTLWGNAPEYEKRDEVALSIKEYVNKVFSIKELTFCKLIQNFSLVCGSGSPQADLKTLMTKSLCPDEIVDHVLEWALGWVKRKTDILLEQRVASNILVDDFRLEITSYIRKHDRRTILASVSKSPDQETIEQHLKELSAYIRQLELLKLKDEQKYRAVNDYLRAEIDRTYWAENCLVHETSFDEFEDSLIREWDNLNEEIGLENLDKSEIIRGRLLYSKCQRIKQQLEGLSVPNHFTPGCLHVLSDEELIGWHPNYKAELKKS
ncbi:ABC-three component system protein [Bacillus anthracis]|uniref:ABC-three component system protein n=1 Tax=Bacillus anthracis TaxID=1392 RepID=UPI00099B336B|nr:ABC-three component system protein [Bacillus anthracis]OPD59412.1 hypothetical protein BVG01_07830 [Bacillus anthracis]